MTTSSIALLLGGALGCIVGVTHGILLQRLLRPAILALPRSPPALTGAMRRLIMPLIQFSTFAWVSGGAVLIFAACWLPAPAQQIASLLVGSQYLYGAIGNLAATRSLHPGWILMTLSIGLICYSNLILART